MLFRSLDGSAKRAKEAKEEATELRKREKEIEKKNKLKGMGSDKLVRETQWPTTSTFVFHMSGLLAG